jgi:flagellar motor protein MotB
MQPDNKNNKPAYNRRLFGEDKHEQHNDSHGTEMGWLVSYADMMTLLFGLFVLLYTMASQKDGSIEQNLKDVSAKYFSQVKTEGKVKAPPLTIMQAEIIQKLESQVAQMKVIPDQRATVAELQQKVQTLEKQVKPTAPVVPDQRQLVTELQKQVETLKQETQNITAQSEAKQKELQKQLTQQRVVASVPVPVVAPQVPQKKIMVISTTWETEKHDVDLVIVDPNGFRYTFKNKRSPSSVGALEIDSRYGPGLELWRTQDLKPGKYKILVKLYNQFGNAKDAIVKTQIVTNVSSIDLPEAVLNNASKEKSYNVNVDEQGTISVE